MGFFEKIKQGLKKTKETLFKDVEKKLKAEKIDDELFDNLEEALIMADVGVKTTDEIIAKLREEIKAQNAKTGEDARAILKLIINDMMSGDDSLIMSTKPSFILVVGVNGVGKTTTIAKISSMLKQKGKKVLLGAADTFRAAAIDQLEIWAKRVGVDVIKNSEGSDPASVVYDTITAATSRGTDIIICDTAGRLHNKKNLMMELSKIYRVAERQIPDAAKEVLLVLDATTGQNAINQAREFMAIINITGVVLTKLDGSAKGGIVIAIKNELGLPVKYIGVGEKMDDLQPFDPFDYVNALFDFESTSLEEDL